MSDYNIDNIERSLEEDVLLDLIETPTNLFIEGVDSALDVDAQNAKIRSLSDKIKALAALMYMKESTILTVRKEDAVKGSIFFNRENNTIEYFDGQAWQSNIFGPNSILDSKSFSINELGISKDSSGITYAPVRDIYLNMDVDEKQIVFIVVDGTLLDKNYFTIDSNNSKHIIFTVPISVYSNLTYYIMGSESSYSGSIPKYETVEYIADGIRTVYPISNNSDFIVTYKSSMMVIVDGKMLKDSDFSLNTQKDSIILNVAPNVGSSIVIKTLYGVVTDFRSSLTYVEQIVEAEIDRQQTFQYNGVCDAVKVYWNGRRLISGKDFDFNYVQKLVVLKDEIRDQVKIGDTLIIEKELVPMSKEPMQGVIVTERKKYDTNKIIDLDNNCNGIVNMIAVSDTGQQTILNSDDYFISDNKVHIVKNGLDNNTFHVSYLTNSRTVDQDIPKIDDFSNSDPLSVWSAKKLAREFNAKANCGGDINQNFEASEFHASNNSSFDGSVLISNKLTVGNKVHATMGQLIVGPAEDAFNFKVTDDLTSVTTDLNIAKNLVVQGDFTIYGRQIGVTLDEISVADNQITLNKNLTAADNPVNETGIKVNRGRNGEANLIFDEQNQSWSIMKTEDGTKKTPISLNGHKHTIDDIITEGLPIYSSINSNPNTNNDFYTNAEYVPLLEAAVSSTEPVKSISRLNLEKAPIVAGELDKDIQSSTILSLEVYKAIKGVSNTTVEKEDSFAVIEDGSIISNSKGAMKLPSGPSNKRWENDNSFCDIPNQIFSSNLKSLATYQDINGLIRYNTDEKCVEMKIDGSWVKFYKPDVSNSKQSEMDYNRGRYIIDFDKTSFTDLANDPLNSSFGLSIGEKVFKIQHNLNSLFVRVDFFDDKRTSFPLLYKCIDENNVYVTFPSNIADLSNSVDVGDWLALLAEPLHTAPTIEGPGSDGKADTQKQLTKKFTAIVTAL